MSTANTVPIIDASKLMSSSTLRALDEACRSWGFFQVVRHGVDRSIIEGL